MALFLFIGENMENQTLLKDYLNNYYNDYIKNTNLNVSNNLSHDRDNDINTDEYLKDLNVDINDVIKIATTILDIKYSDFVINSNSIYISNSNENLLSNKLNDYYFKKIPLQYILGYKFFYNEKYIVNNNVLIPRDDSEILVEVACKYIKKENLKNMLDLCTGSGAIGISIAANSKIENVELVDISKKALSVATKNCVLNGVTGKCKTIHSNLLKNYIKGFLNNMKYDIIVSNPPYIKTSVLDSLSEYVKKEPVLALDGGEEGLDIYFRILKEATYVLKENGILILEIGYDQNSVLSQYINSKTDFEVIENIKDFGGNDRVIVCRFLRI